MKFIACIQSRETYSRVAFFYYLYNNNKLYFRVVIFSKADGINIDFRQHNDKYFYNDKR